jgi:hypothetical protein
VLLSKWFVGSIVEFRIAFNMPSSNIIVLVSSAQSNFIFMPNNLLSQLNQQLKFITLSLSTPVLTFTSTTSVFFSVAQHFWPYSITNIL